MFVAVDVGNSNVVIGLFASRDAGTGDPIDHWRAATEQRRTADEWLMILRQFLSWHDVGIEQVEAIVLASVVPGVTSSFRRLAERSGIELLVLDWTTDTGVPILIDDPREAGADRLANAVAAFALWGGPSIVVDLGTATTLDVVSVDGEYLGGVILPGVEISLEALFTRAAALRRMELSAPPEVIGKSTIDAVRAGATFGYASQIDGLCARIERQLGTCRVVATGGVGTVIAPLSERVETYDPWLTLRGLSLIYQRSLR